MIDGDFSKEIFEIWFESGKILIIKLKTGHILEGVLAGFYHGDETEPYIVKWDFINEKDFKAFGKSSDIPESCKMTINQEDILGIDFKYKD